jgi:hypothetical protein
MHQRPPRAALAQYKDYRDEQGGFSDRRSPGDRRISYIRARHILHKVLRPVRSSEPTIICVRAWIGAIGPIIAVFALLVALSQFYLSRESAQRQMRAYMGVADGSFRLVNLREGGQGIQVQVRLRNSGKSPAYDFTTWIAAPLIAGASDDPFGSPLPLSERTSSSVVFADGDVHLARAAAITPEQIQAVRAGSSKIFAWGGADYRDAFGVLRTLRFYDINADDEAGQGLWALKPHRKGYQAD